MKRNYGSSSVDFSVLDELKFGDLVMINGFSFTRTEKTKGYHEPSSSDFYEFRNENGLIHMIYVQQQIDRREAPGLRGENMRKKPIGATLCNKFDSFDVTSLVRR